MLPFDSNSIFDAPLLALASGGTLGIIGAALSLGIRHGIDWDHIAAITDITSTAAATPDEDEGWLVREPGFMLTDESHHSIAPQEETEVSEVHSGVTVEVRGGGLQKAAVDGHSHGPAGHLHRHDDGALAAFVQRQRPALLLGTMYAFGHGTVVLVLGLAAILAKGFLPDWIDPVMERIVGLTLLFLAAYLFYSLFRFFRGDGDFRLRSRWMLVFAGIRNVWGALRERLLGRPHEHVHEAQRYGVRTAVGIGMIHGIGAETGTQALIIATAVGAKSQAAGVLALAAFLAGLLISNSAVTVISTAGFVSSAQRRWIYVGAGLFAAIFSLVVGLVFVFDWADALPSLDPFG